MFRSLIVIYFFIFIGPSYAARIFKNFEPVKDYNEVLDSIKYGDEIITTTKHFRVLERLDIDSNNVVKGNWSAVFRIEDGKVIKVPKNIDTECSDDFFNDNFDYNEDLDFGAGGFSKAHLTGHFKPGRKECLAQKALKSFVNGYHLLEELGVPVVKLYIKESDASEVVVVEDLGKKHFTAQEYFSSQYKKQLDNRDYEFFLEKLKEFFLKTWKFEYIGDFSSLSQVGWDGKEWKLFDWENAHRVYGTNKENNATVINYVTFDSSSYLYPKSFNNTLLSWHSLIVEKRKNCLKSLLN